MKNSIPVILSSVLLSAFVSISGVQGQSFGTCILSDTAAPDNIDPTLVPFYNVQTIYSILCEARQTVTTTVPTAGTVNPNFTLLCGLLIPGGGYDGVRNILNNPALKGITFFAPDNTAIAAATAAGELAGGVFELTRILETHILPTAFVTENLKCDQCECTFEGGGLCRTRTRTKCPTASRIFQVGAGNFGPVLTGPEIGKPLSSTALFQNEDDFVATGNLRYWGDANSNFILSNSDFRFSENAVACNGVIHGVNKVILPGNGFNQQCGTGGKGGKGGKGGYYGGVYYGGKGGKGGYYFGYGGKGGGKGTKGGFFGCDPSPFCMGITCCRRLELDLEETFFEEGDEDEDEVVEEVDSSGSQQDDERSNTSAEERSQRRRRQLESLINSNGEIEQLE